MVELIFVALFAGLALLWLFRRPDFIPPETAPSDERVWRQFEAAPSLFVNRAETAFFRTLQRDLPPSCHLHAKVRLEDIIRVRPSVKTPEVRWKLRGRVKSRHVDFLITDGVGVPLAAIELDGTAHNQPEAGHADTLKDGLFAYADIPLFRVAAGSDYLQATEKIVAALPNPNRN